MKTKHNLRRTLLTLLALAPLAATLPAHAQKAPDTVRIGYQKSSTLITVLKTRATLEQKLAPLGVKVTWHEFASGLPLLEALNVGAVDVSADVADTVPIFAQAAGAQLTFIAQEAPSPTAQAIVVKEDSPIKSIADLRGKRIGFAKAAGAHYLLIAALEKNGLSLKDVTQAYLAPADGRAAFERNAIDAWVIWDPFLAAVQRQSKVRVLADGTDLASYQRYYLASTPFAKARPDVVKVIVNSLQETGKWVKQSPQDAAALLAPVWGLDTATVEQANARRSYLVRSVVPGSIGEQQKIADAFLDAGLLPKKVDATNVPLF
ncbi:aliphatic sulfonate ABC transporter substrate-binding protein [Oxalicibacterium faecigallinarum]|uniref:Putative aliphatic sulfonates-binding protein n=1 Tax=Oxalicibacterium faecigallinarum TaxID=573741 RepID=A0A8J3F4A5_9BURK|nr:ABC transporter substrate-binding protein [Oxalicibacterium faecigallinarum]